MGRGYWRERTGWLTINVSLFKVNICYKVRLGFVACWRWLKIVQETQRKIDKFQYRVEGWGWVGGDGGWRWVMGANEMRAVAKNIWQVVWEMEFHGLGEADS